MLRIRGKNNLTTCSLREQSERVVDKKPGTAMFENGVMQHTLSE
ncbi:MAG TPA: hypothetical protein VLF61_02390 [Rhabdochlamydiaceae bacterium]|nr:hypothetical protein [Rhabdochlamydiaceae bacterium]